MPPESLVRRGDPRAAGQGRALFLCWGGSLPPVFWALELLVFRGPLRLYVCKLKLDLSLRQVLPGTLAESTRGAGSSGTGLGARRSQWWVGSWV